MQIYRRAGKLFAGGVHKRQRIRHHDTRRAVPAAGANLWRFGRQPCRAARAELPLSELRADGGPTANKYLMQFQSNIAQVTVSVSDVAELSGFGAACAAGFSCGLYDPETIFANTHRSYFTPEMDNTEREARYNGWQKAVRQALKH